MKTIPEGNQNGITGSYNPKITEMGYTTNHPVNGITFGQISSTKLIDQQLNSLPNFRK